MTRIQLNTRNRSHAGLKAVLGAGVLMFAGTFAYGDSITFDFNTLAAGATNATIASTMTTLLVNNGCIGCSVTVTDGKSGTVYADTTYTADNNVVGKNGKTITPVTIGDTDGATGNNASVNTSKTGAVVYDTFLSNVSNGGTSGGNQIDLSFSGFTFDGAVSFDFEIFPDINCQALTRASCGGNPTGGIYPDQPSFGLESGLNGGALSAVGAFGTNGTLYALAPGAAYDGGSTKSPNYNPELAPQYIGTFSTSTLTGQNDLAFLDWPAAIGIDNLTINYTPPGRGNNPPVPETSSVLLLGTVSALLVPLFRRFRKA